MWLPGEPRGALQKAAGGAPLDALGLQEKPQGTIWYGRVTTRFKGTPDNRLPPKNPTGLRERAHHEREQALSMAEREAPSQVGTNSFPCVFFSLSPASLGIQPHLWWAGRVYRPREASWSHLPFPISRPLCWNSPIQGRKKSYCQAKSGFVYFPGRGILISGSKFT